MKAAHIVAHAQQERRRIRRRAPCWPDSGWQCSLGRDWLGCGQDDPLRRLLARPRNR